MPEPSHILKRRIQFWIVLFMMGLVLSGATALPLDAELTWLTRLLHLPDHADPHAYSGLAYWLLHIRDGLHAAYHQYPFLAYGTDWLAFGHFVIAIAFWGPLRDPVRNEWVLTFGMIACVLLIPYAFIFGGLRGIPIYWRLVDCSFGVVGMIPLWFCRRWIHRLAKADS